MGLTDVASPITNHSVMNGNDANDNDRNDNTKIVIEERLDEQGRRVKVTRKIKLRLVHEKVTPEVAARREWRKFGDAANDGPGPNLSSTIVSEPVYLKLGMGKDHEEPAKTAAVVQAKNIACRYCQGAHWSARCPFKSTFADDVKDASAATGEDGKDEQPAKLKYIPPSMRKLMEAGGDGADGLLSTTSARDNPNTVRMSNLAEITAEGDLRDLVGRIAQPARVYVVKDQRTGMCRGSAFISFHIIEDAERVIKKLNGYLYGNMVLSVEMAKPQQL